MPVVRTTISIPEDLKKRMDACRVEMNWSEIAAEAFEQKLGDVAANKQKKTMQDVIQRLKASRKRSEAEESKQGLKLGRKWAETAAEWDELERLDEAEGEENHSDLFNEPHRGGPSFFCSTKDGSDHLDEKDLQGFWRTWGGIAKPSHDFVNAFWDGAVQVYREVRDKVYKD